MRQARLRAVITLDPAEPRPATLHPPAQQYPNPTRALVIRARPLRNAGSYFDAGQRFTLWSGGDVGHGLIARKVYMRYSPS